MARFTQDREDLMREATALVRRVELQVPAGVHLRQPPTCIIGFRRTGEASIFVGADPVFQFNAAGELRRGFWDGQLLKAEAGRLVRLERRRTETESQLVRHELTASQTAEFVRLAEETLDCLDQLLCSDDLLIVKQVPAHMDVVRELADWLNSLPRPIKIALLPHVRS